MSLSGGRAVLRYSLMVACACAVAACGGSEAQPSPTSTPGADAPTDERPVVLFLGTSLTAGYGLPSDDAFPALLGQRIDDAGHAYRVVNAGVSGDTSAGGLRRLDWLLRMPIAVLVLELGANDMLRGQDPAALARNLKAIVERTRSAHPEVRLLVAGMRAAPNLGARYAEAFEGVYPALAAAYDGAFLPFLLDGVAGQRSLNQVDGIHPTAEGHRLLADNLWPVLEPLL